MAISISSLLVKGSYVRIIKKNEKFFYRLHVLFLSTILFVISFSVIFHPLPISIFLTLAYGSFSYGLLLFFKISENYSEIFLHLNKKFSFSLGKEINFLLIVSFIILLLLLLYFLIVPFEAYVSDVDDAIISAVQGFSRGINPYEAAIVPHMNKKNDLADITRSASNVDIYATYNYLPVDLLLYYFFFLLFSPFLGSLWFYFTNTVVFVVCTALFSKTHNLTIFKSLLFFLPSILIGGLISNDIWLIVFYLLFLTWIDKFKESRVFLIGAVTFLTLGFLTKMLLIFLLPVFLLYIAVSWSSRIKYVFFSAFFSLIVVSLFNFSAVFSSVFFFHSNLEARGQLAFVGGVLAVPLEYLGLDALYLPLFVLSYLLVLWSAKYYSSTLEGQMLYVSAIVILLLPSGNFMPTLLVIGLIGSYRIIVNKHFTLSARLRDNLPNKSLVLSSVQEESIS